MNAAFNTLFADASEADFSPLEPKAKFFAATGCLIYLTADKSYRAVRLSPFITVLLDPSQDVAIGLKVKGVREVMERFSAILKGMKVERSAVELLAVIELALTLGLGDELMAEADAERRKKYEPEVRRLATQAGQIEMDEVPLAA